MAARYTKSIPEYVYFWGTGEWIQGPFVRPQLHRENRKFKLVEVPMDEPKKKNNDKIVENIIKELKQK